jgi:NAD(P)H dehydrogenase (quinone)
LRILLLYANPIEASFGAPLHAAVKSALSRHDLDDCDLYAERFDPVLSREERVNYNDQLNNPRNVAPYTQRLSAAEALVLVFPVWNQGFPAILKGFIDRVFIPGVVFVVDRRGETKPALKNCRKIACVYTYGADRLTTLFLGDPTRRVVKRMLCAIPGRPVSCDYLALYDLNHAQSPPIASYLTSTPLLADYLEEGLSQFGQSCGD